MPPRYKSRAFFSPGKKIWRNALKVVFPGTTFREKFLLFKSRGNELMGFRRKLRRVLLNQMHSPGLVTRRPPSRLTEQSRGGGGKGGYWAVGRRVIEKEVSPMTSLTNYEEVGGQLTMMEWKWVTKTEKSRRLLFPVQALATPIPKPFRRGLKCLISIRFFGRNELK